MPVYISLLRGINVGGNKRIKMEHLRASFQALGFEQVQTYIQSGNVVFKAGKLPPAKLSKKIEERILSDFGFPVPVVTRTGDEICESVANNPFLKQRGIDLTRLHVMFLSDTPSPAALKKLAELKTAPDQHLCLGKDIFLHLPNGAGESILMKAPLDRILAVVPTTRNWNTVNQLAQMCRDCR